MLKDDGMNSPRKPGNIQLELDALSETVVLLKVELEELRSRFGMVLNPNSKTPADTLEEPQLVVSQLADTIGGINGQMVDVIHLVRAMLEECDL